MPGTDAELLAAPFAHAATVDSDRLHRQRTRLEAAHLLSPLLNDLPVTFAILNADRQIVVSNIRGKGMDRFTVADLDGLRLGEAFGCRHADGPPAGCGTTRFCQTCGAMQVTRAALQGRKSMEECRLQPKDSAEPLDLRVWGQPLVVDGESYTLLYLADISHEKRRSVLERVFFHDLLNTAGGIQGFSELLMDADPEEFAELRGIIHASATALVEEIQAFRQLQAAENGSLEVDWTEVDASRVAYDLAGLYRGHEVATGRFLKVDCPEDSGCFPGEPVLVRRVIGNMVKNALEASLPGETVHLRVQRGAGDIAFSVHNPTVTPVHVQLQVFQRSFSTKGSGRGLGCYSMKLLGEDVLGGSVSFHSEAGHGTTFIARFSLERA